MSSIGNAENALSRLLTSLEGLVEARDKLRQIASLEQALDERKMQLGELQTAQAEAVAARDAARANTEQLIAEANAEAQRLKLAAAEEAAAARAEATRLRADAERDATEMRGLATAKLAEVTELRTKLAAAVGSLAG